jgi:hypothetical protein
MDGRSGAQGFFPAGLKSVPEFVAHPFRGVGIEAAHAGHLVAEALLGQDLRDAIFGHPRPVAVLLRRDWQEVLPTRQVRAL